MRFNDLWCEKPNKPNNLKLVHRKKKMSDQYFYIERAPQYKVKLSRITLSDNKINLTSQAQEIDSQTLDIHLKNEKVSGHIYQGEKDRKTKKESLLIYRLEEQEPVCEIVEIVKKDTQQIEIKSVFKFKLMDWKYQIRHHGNLFCNFFEIKDKETKQIKFSCSYWYPFKRSIYYDQWTDDMRLKELASDYGMKNIYFSNMKKWLIPI